MFGVSKVCVQVHNLTALGFYYTLLLCHSHGWLDELRTLME